MSYQVAFVRKAKVVIVKCIVTGLIPQDAAKCVASVSLCPLTCIDSSQRPTPGRFPRREETPVEL